MDFMGIGFPELLFILFLALMVFGPGKLPEFARMLGQGMRKFKMATTELTQAITEEMNKDISEVKSEITETGKAISSEVKEIGESITKDVDLDLEQSSGRVEEETKEDAPVHESGDE